MSVQNFFGSSINPPRSSEDTITYADVNGMVTNIKAMKIDDSLGDADQVLGSDGNGGLEWRTVQDQGIVPTLGQVMGEGNACSNNIDMNDFGIISTSNLPITCEGRLKLIADLGICFEGENESTGLLGDVMTSGGDGEKPYWLKPVIPVATANLQMAGYAIDNVSGLSGNGLEVDCSTEFTDDVVFANPPTCATEASTDTQLTNKAYVDGLVASVSGMSPDIQNTFSVSQTFDAGLTVNNQPAIFNAGAVSSIIGVDYCILHPTIASYYSFGGAVNISSKDNFYNCYWETNTNFDITLPVPVVNYAGMNLTIMNMCQYSNGNEVIVTATPLYDCVSGAQSHVYTSCHFKRFGFCTFTCLQDYTGGWSWMVLNCSKVGDSTCAFSGG